MCPGKFGVAVALASTTLSSFAMAQAPAPQAPARSLEEQFGNPPADARPRVWWHWVDGNVTKEGIEKDLTWMSRIGIAGFQNFDAARDAPQIVDHRIVYMSPEWRDMFRFAVARANTLGLEYGIAASPGWSETGGPWVKPEDAMKKLVWSVTTIAGGKRFDGLLAMPPAVPGPYQDVARAPDHGSQAPDFYRDAVVVAFREDAEAPAKAETVSANGNLVDGATLTDADDATGIPLPGNTAESPGIVAISYAKPRTVRSLRLVVTNPPNSAIAGPLSPRLEASNDGESWREVATLPLTNVPTTASFAPVTAQHFRLVFRSAARADRSSFVPAPGVDLRAALGVGGSGGRPAAPKITTLALSAKPRIHAAELKAGFALADDYYALDGSPTDDAGGIPPASVVDLTRAMAADGRLRWTPPKGHWTVLRMGYSLTGKTNAPATRESTGLEVDKYDAPAVARYLTTYLNGYRQATGDALFGRRGLTTLITDSTEVGPSNWTPDMLDQFRRLRGYDARPWLPALTGAIVGSRRQSDAFLYDFRRTLADLTTSEHYRTIARVAQAQGLTVYGESLEGGRTISSLGDDLDMRRHADVPMGAMWAYGQKPAANLIADMRGAASVAHVYGKPYVAAESLTSILNPWAHTPGDLQPMIDAEFLSGINRPFLHSVVHQPRDDRQPGLSLQAFGQYFNRHETWAEMAKPWMDYIARSSLLLQQGRNVADVAYFYGEEAPIGTQALKAYPADVPRRYAYDFVSAEMLLNALTARNGALVSEGGAKYRAVQLGGTSSRMTVPVLRKLSALADAGIAVVGQAPVSSPALADDPAEFSALVKRLWGDGGRAQAGVAIEAALVQAGVAPDFAFTGMADSDIQFVHRTADEAEIYFVSNRKLRAEPIEARFRVSGKTPELWHADDGSAQPVSYRFENGETVVPLDLAAGESVFVLFRKPAALSALTVAKPQLVPIAAIDGAWDVAFQPGRGAPATATFPALGSLSAQADPGIKYFSGVATYHKQFTLPPIARGAELILDLGKVGDVAEVLINGRPAGIAWKAPNRVKIGSLVHPGKNTLEIRVANLWVNRLIGDQQPNATKVTFTTTPTYTPKAPLRPSGLIGPVQILRPMSGNATAGGPVARRR